MNAKRHQASPASRVFVEFRPAMRALIEDAVESLLLLLDEIDGDADFEAEPDDEDASDFEQDLGATNALDQRKAWACCGAPGCDGTREFGGDGVADCDAEPSLGSLEANSTLSVSIDQSDWARGTRDDLEENIGRDDREESYCGL